MKMSVRILCIPNDISSSYSYSVIGYNLICIHWEKKFQIEHYLNLNILFVEIFDGKRLLWARDFEKC